MTDSPRFAFASVAVVIGLVLLGTAGYTWVRYVSQPAPYHYEMGEIIPAANLDQWSALAGQNIPIRKASVVNAGAQQLVRLTVAESESGPVLVEWQPSVDGPFLYSPPPSADVTSLAPVLKRHIGNNETVLSWWDTARQLALLSPANYAFSEPLGIPLFVSPEWSDQRMKIDAVEAAFWKQHNDGNDQARFLRFAHALLSEPTGGLAEMRALAGQQKAVLVIHARDVLLLGQLAPDKIGVAIRDFPNTGDVHSMVAVVKDWLRRNNYEAYSIVHLDGGATIRAIALTDKASGRTLVARLLPFVGTDQSSVPGTVLVYKTGGFWVYELEAEKQVAAMTISNLKDTP